MNIPILLYHHVNWVDKDPTLNVKPDIFERQMSFLHKNGYKTVFLNELIELEKENNQSKIAAITFDDGYLDNWIYAYPILKKYGIKATIFVTTSNIRDTEEIDTQPCRDTHFNINFDTSPKQPNTKKGFMTWPELKRMQASGLIDIQSHSHTHGYYYVSDKITGFNHMQHWAVPWPTDGDARLGIPLYERGPSLMARRYYDDASLRDYLADLANKSGNALILRLSHARWEKKLFEKANTFLSFNRLTGHYESSQEYTERIENELRLSMTLIENHLNKECAYLSFPAGKFNEVAIEAAKKVGYKRACINKRLNDNNLDFILPRIIVSGTLNSFLRALHNEKSIDYCDKFSSGRGA